MMESTGGSFGLQLGGQATDFVILVMNDRGSTQRSRRIRRDQRFHAGRNAFLFSLAWVFGGVSPEGATLQRDGGANENLYGKKVDAEHIVVKGAVPMPDSASLLLSTLNEHSHRNASANK